MKTVKIKQENIDSALTKMDAKPYSFRNDSLKYRMGYISALQDLGIIDSISAARMTIKTANEMVGND